MRAVIAVIAALFATSVSGSATCAGCSVVVGLLGQLSGKDGVPPNEWPFNVNPDDLCVNLTLCDGSCTLWGPAWPVTAPPFPTDGKADDTAPPADTQSLVGDPSPRSKAVQRLRELAAENEVLELPGELERAVSFLDTNRDVLEEADAGIFFGMGRAASRSALRTALRGVQGLSGSLPCDDLLNFTCDEHTLFDNHLPLADEDEDFHAGGNLSLLTTNLRGVSWRGRDCDDTNAAVYPGRRTVAAGLSADVDHNCNGIKGTPSGSNTSYEEMFCSGENAPMGVVGIGDSALAHFHIPPQYLNARNFSLDHVLEAASNELDWPQCSWSTGFRETSACPASPIPMGSIYQRLRERNLCMHRDYTNIGVNGARVSSAADVLIPNLHRDAQNDAPVLLFYALIGNDVCNGHPGLSHMTTPAEFRTAVLSSFSQLNASLPRGSRVAVMGLVDGLILFDTMHNQTHPLGVEYPAVYDALTCNGANPCNGWLTSNDTLRNLTQQRANNLTAVYDEIIQEFGAHYTFDVYRLKLNWEALFQEYVSKYGNPRGAIEPVDGFHPSQATHQLLAQIIFQDLEQNKPDWLPPINPNNDQIRQLFGDQGGY